MTKKMAKGEHEKAVEAAKELIDKGIGMTEIIEKTGLSTHDITKIKNELIDEELL